MNKEYLIDSITDAALDTFYRSGVLPENYRNITVHCNETTHKILSDELEEKAAGIVYIQEQWKVLKESTEKAGGTFAMVNGITIKFKVDEKYPMLIVCLDTLSPEIEEDE